jgi:hypothetical protein
VHDEEQRAVVDARQPRAEAAFEGLFVMFLLYDAGLRLPLDAERRVSEQVVEPVPGQTVLGEAVYNFNSCKTLPKRKYLTTFTLTSIARPFKIASPFAAPPQLVVLMRRESFC